MALLTQNPTIGTRRDIGTWSKDPCPVLSRYHIPVYGGTNKDKCPAMSRPVPPLTGGEQ